MRFHDSACEGLFLPARLLSRSVSRCAATRDRAVRRASGAPEHHCHHNASFTCARSEQHKHHTLLPRRPPSTAATLMSALVVLAMAAVADGATLFFSQFQEASSGNNK